MYNEAPNLPPLYSELKLCIARLKKYRFEIIFVDDGSKDDSAAVARRLAKRDRRLRVLELSRNFGKEPAMTAGLRAAKGDAAVIIDADMQMPPRLIGKFVKKWEEGSEVVIGVFGNRNTSRLHAVGSHWFYRIMQQISTTEVIPHETDYRLIDRKVINEYNRLTERNRIARGLIDWLGFKRSTISFEQEPRLNGRPAYTYRKLVGLAVNSFTAESLVPLKLAGYLGTTILLLAIPTGGVMTINRLVYHWPIRGTAFLAILIVALVGVVLACLGLMALYIARIHAEASNRPLYVVRDDYRAERRSREEYAYVPEGEVVFEGAIER